MPNRRFSECWQFLSDYPGTEEQRDAVIEAFRLEYGTPRHRAFQRLDRSINSIYKRSYLTFGFVPAEWFGPNQIAVAGPTGINLSEGFAPEAIADQADHEIGHCFDSHFLTSATRLEFMVMAGIDPNLNTWNHNVKETWADACRDWQRGTGWNQLTGIILP